MVVSLLLSLQMNSNLYRVSFLEIKNTEEIDAFASFSLNPPFQEAQILSFIKKNEETRKNDELNAELKSIKATLKKAVDECDRREDAHHSRFSRRHV